MARLNFTTRSTVNEYCSFSWRTHVVLAHFIAATDSIIAVDGIINIYLLKQPVLLPIDRQQDVPNSKKTFSIRFL